MTKPRLLDAFSGAGGCARGYQQAGFHVTGIDIKPQPRFSGDVFIQGDALEYIAEHGREFDAIHASPPCQAYSEATPLHHRATLPELIAPTRELLIASGRPYVIENVENARRHLINPVMLCGSMFGLAVWRHRYFEVSPMWFLAPSMCVHEGRPVSLHPGSNARKGRGGPTVIEAREAMGIDWMTGHELNEAIPPAYTFFIGTQIMAAIAWQRGEVAS